MVASLPALEVRGRVAPHPAGRATMVRFTGVKVFSTTLARDREGMGEQIGRWLSEHQELEVVDRVVAQSSDKEFHCLSIILFYRERKGA
jgi:hypothetical protein